MGQTISNPIAGRDLKLTQKKTTKNYYKREEKKPIQKLWNLPHQNGNFTGREELRAEIKEKFINGCQNSSVVITSLWGLGGVGKTQLAVQIGYELQEYYSHIFWIQTESKISIERCYRELARDIGYKEVEPERIIKMVKNWLEQNSGNLIVYDNAPDYNTIKNYLPNGDNHFLITSRYTEWSSNTHVINVTCFSPEEAQPYIQKILKDRGLNSLEDIQQLSKILGYLPLALAQACGYMTQVSKTSIKEYLKRYEAEKKKYLAHPTLPAEESGRKGEDAAHLPVYITFKLAKEAIEEESPLAGNILSLYAFLNSEKIPDFLSKDILQSEEDNAEKEAFDYALTLLGNYSLLIRDIENRFSTLHVLLQQVILLELKEKNEFANTIHLIAEFLQRKLHYKRQNESIKIFQILLHHICIFIEHSQKDKNIFHNIPRQLLGNINYQVGIY